jgi:hypothetical protein
VIFASAASLYTTLLVNRIARQTAGAVPKGWLTLGREQIILISGIHYVRSEWRQVEIQPGTQTEDRSAEAHPRTAGARSKGIQVRGHHGPRSATVGVGMITPLPSALPLPATNPGGRQEEASAAR